MRSLRAAFSADTPDPQRAKAKPDPDRVARRFAAHRWSRRQRRAGLFMTAVFLCGLIGVITWSTLTGRLDVLSLKFGLWLENRLADQGFYIPNIEIEGHRFTSHEDVTRVLGIYDREPLTRLNPAHAVRQLSALPWVEEVRVQRLWPQTIKIWIKERVPLAVLHRGGQLYVVDERGELIMEASARLAQVYPNLSGQGAGQAAPALLTALAAYPDLHARFVGATRLSDQRWNLYLTPGIEVRLPAGDVRVGLSRLMTLDQENQILGKAIRVLDLRGQRPIVVLDDLP